MFNEIAKNFPNIKFTWIGDGELEDHFTEPNIEITGWKTREEVLQILNNNDIFLLTSLWEGLPISLLEAMYLKKVCIVSNVVGNRDVIVDGQNGFVAQNLKEFNQKISNISNKEIDINEIIIMAYNDILNIYNTDKMCENYKKIYNNE